MYAYNVKEHRYTKTSPFCLAFKQTPRKHVNVAPERPSLVLDGDAELPLYAGLELVQHSRSLQKETDKNLRMT